MVRENDLPRRKLLQILSDWVWHHFFEKLGGLPCDRCDDIRKADIAKKARPNPANVQEPLKKEEDPNKKRYGCPQDHKTAKGFIDSL